MDDSKHISQIFDNIVGEFDLFRKRKPESLILKFFKERGVDARYAKSTRGLKTIGVFQNKKVCGPAFVIYGPRDLFFGEYADSKKNGKGFHLYPNGFMYKGEYLDDKKVDGVVVDSATGRDVYVGEWDSDNYNGSGVLRNPYTGSIYEGEFVGGLFEGYGKLTWSTGDHYVGNFRQGRQDGRGTLVLQGKGEYDGYFCAGTYHGRGSIRYASGDMYNGNFERGSKIGRAHV